jgi:hypothetical protein
VIEVDKEETEADCLSLSEIVVDGIVSNIDPYRPTQ